MPQILKTPTATRIVGALVKILVTVIVFMLRISKNASSQKTRHDPCNCHRLLMLQISKVPTANSHQDDGCPGHSNGAHHPFHRGKSETTNPIGGQGERSDRPEQKLNTELLKAPHNSTSVLLPPKEQFVAAG